MGVAPAHRDEQLEALRAENRVLKDLLVESHRLATTGTMTAMLAHEFNNLLTPIVGYAELAKQDPALVAKALDKACAGGQHAKDLCRALLAVCRGQETPNEAVDLRAVIDRTLEAIPCPPHQDEIDLTVAVPAGLTLQARPTELQQILLNLLLNARRAILASSPPHRIDIRGVLADGTCAVTVRDNGVGIAREDLARIFDPFFSTADPAEGNGGSGLGLAVCRRMVDSLGGQIAVSSTLGEGTTFTITLPVG